ncbi:DUF2061 domain-containing protein [Patescibacteria group bacterium]|nr:DUF2061 domain-containing protein [Patescibacteria group bacterium]
MQETHARSIIKGLTWRLIATTTTVILVFIFTRNLTLSLEIGILDISLKLLFYYLHERGWNMLKWGRIINQS